MVKSELNVKNSLDLKRQLDIIDIENESGEDYSLVTFDVVNMYTNIPLDIVLEIIKLDYHRIQTNISLDTFLNLLDYAIKNSSIFMALDQYYLQKEGQPMGGSLSTVLACIFMDYFLDKIICSDKSNIFFLKKYVDDFFGIIKKNSIKEVYNKLNLMHNRINFTQNVPIDDGMITFLDLSIKIEENKIQTEWFRKDFASDRILSFYSAHPLETKKNVVKNFLKKPLLLTSNLDRKYALLHKAEKILLLNGYSKIFIKSIKKNIIEEINSEYQFNF